ncbi:MFS transporter [Brevibacillus sp. SYP-B805]|uniref:MFS transporter n=1 Tax=Brevibacillus sp. SYP-B805 TaxID=1578199 RepID=UPI001F49F3BB
MNEVSNRRQVTIIALITAVCLLGDSFLYIALPTHWRELGLQSPLQVGILLSANRFVRLPLNPLIGWLYQKISRRSGIVMAVVLAIATTASYGLLQGFWPLLAMRCLWGAAWTFLRLGAFFTILDVTHDQNRGVYLGRYNGLYRLGSLVGMLAGGLLADQVGFSAAAVLFAAMAVPALPVVLRIVPANKTEKTIGSAADTPAVWREPSVLWSLLAGLLVAMLYQGVFTSTLSYVIDSREIVLTAAGTAIGAATLAGILQAIRWGWEPWLAPLFGKLSDGRHGRRSIFVLSLLLACCLFALIPMPLPTGVWLAVLLAVQVTSTALTTVTDALASDAAVRSSKAKVMTAYSVATDLGAALGPLLAYFIAGKWGLADLYWGSAFLLLLLALRWGMVKMEKAECPSVQRDAGGSSGL